MDPQKPPPKPAQSTLQDLLQTPPAFEKLLPPQLAVPVSPDTSSDTRPASVKPLQNAVAINYETTSGAPRIVAKGRGLVAEQIIARAKEHGVFVHESKELVALLMQVELDDHIPPALYRAVAELLAWLYHIEAARQGGSKV